MNDLDVAKLVLVSCSAADGGCVPCVQSCIDEALHLYPDLPWDEAVDKLAEGHRRENLREAIQSARKWLEAGNDPRVEDDDLFEIVV